MNLPAQQVLVTGAPGWLGTSLVESLVRGLPDVPSLSQPNPHLQIRCLILPSQDDAPLRRLSDKIKIVRGDLRNPTDCQSFCQDTRGALLFHAAGIIHPRRVAEFMAINRDGTVNLLDAAGRAGVRRAVVVSSNSPCGCNPHPDHLFDELSPYHPWLNYGRSKMAMELAIQDRQNMGGLETVIIRAPWFYGPNQPARQSHFFRMIRDGKAPIVGSGQNLRSMTYIENLCQGLLLAAITERANGQTYWIADRRPYSMNEIVDTIERLLETEFGQVCKHRRLRLPSIAGTLAYAADASLQSLGLYHQKIHVLAEMNRTIACSVARAERELGYRPVVALEEGMRRSLAWCVAHGLGF
jgi:nucleoside-diphosphate-sugar epimerase